MALQVVFAGPDDEETCDGCEGAVNDGPYDISEAPEPGDFECRGNCRHILQLVGEDDGDEAEDGQTYTYTGSVGFTENPVQGKYDYSDQADEERRKLRGFTPLAVYPGYEPIDETPGFNPEDNTPGYGTSYGPFDLTGDPLEYTPGYTAPWDATPGYTSLDDLLNPARSEYMRYVGADDPDDVMNAASREWFGVVPELVDFDQMEGENADAIAQFMFDTGIEPDEMILALGLDEEDAAAIRLEYAKIMGDNLTEDTARTLLISGNVEQLQQLADDDSFKKLLQKIATGGFADSDAAQAYYLSEVIGGTPYMADDGRWYLSLRESIRIREGGKGSGDFGHSGRQHYVGGSSKNPPNQASLVKHILAHWDASSDKDKRHGKYWYNAAHAFAQGLAKQYGITLKQSAGIIAALSPQNSWAHNMTLATQMAEKGKAMTGGTLGRSLAQAHAIMEGNDPEEVLTGAKTRSFYANILDPNEADHVTIDRHAVALSVGPTSNFDIKALDNKGNYEHFSDAYKEAARQRSVTPSQMQAVTWEHYRKTALNRSIDKGEVAFQRFFKEGGPGSGFRGHAGRHGKVGGSAPIGTDFKFNDDDLAVANDPKVKEIIDQYVGLAKDENFDGVLYHAMDSGQHADKVRSGKEPFYNTGSAEGSSGAFGPGLYFANSAEETSGYGPDVFAVDVKAHLVDFDQDAYDELIDKVAKSSGVPDGDEFLAQRGVAAALQARGYDGMRIKFPGSAGGDYTPIWDAGKSLKKIEQPQL